MFKSLCFGYSFPLLQPDDPVVEDDEEEDDDDDDDDKDDDEAEGVNWIQPLFLFASCFHSFAPSLDLMTHATTSMCVLFASHPKCFRKRGKRLVAL